MSIRSTAFFVTAGPTVIVFTTKAIELSKPTFFVNKVTVVFSTAAIQVATNTFDVVRGVTNYDNGFMAF